MSYRDNAAALKAFRAQIADIRKKMREVQAAVEPETVSDYTFSTPEGTTRLTDLLGVKNALFVIHNMGASCPYCTLWADGFNGISSIWRTARRLSFARRTRRMCNVASRPAEAGASRWSVTPEPVSLPIWATGRNPEAGCRASRCSGARRIALCA